MGTAEAAAQMSSVENTVFIIQYLNVPVSAVTCILSQPMHLESAELVPCQVADLFLEETDVDVDKADDQGNTPLLAAIKVSGMKLVCGGGCVWENGWSL